MGYRQQLFYGALLILTLGGAANAAEVHVRQLNDEMSVRNLSPDSQRGGVFVRQIPPGTVPPQAVARGRQRQGVPVARVFLQTAGAAAVSTPAGTVAQEPAVSAYTGARPAVPTIGPGAGVIISGSKPQQTLPSVGKGAVLL